MAVSEQTCDKDALFFSYVSEKVWQCDSSSCLYVDLKAWDISKR